MRKLSRALVVASFAAIILPATAFAAWPVASRTAYVSQFASRHHPAVDISAHKGTRVVAIRSGKTVFAGWKANCGGRQVWVYHGHGLYSAYYHLSSLSTHRGELVTGGSETIGHVGRTGCASGAHLHVEVWHGRPWATGSYRVNPWRYVDNGRLLPRRYR
jgi:murein DD-endopeptidase MepM/ murein hydrolase activator NlpD